MCKIYIKIIYMGYKYLESGNLYVKVVRIDAGSDRLVRFTKSLYFYICRIWWKLCSQKSIESLYFQSSLLHILRITMELNLILQASESKNSEKEMKRPGLEKIGFI